MVVLSLEIISNLWNKPTLASFLYDVSDYLCKTRIVDQLQEVRQSATWYLMA